MNTQFKRDAFLALLNQTPLATIDRQTLLLSNWKYVDSQSTTEDQFNLHMEASEESSKEGTKVYPLSFDISIPGIVRIRSFSFNHEALLASLAELLNKIEFPYFYLQMVHPFMLRPMDDAVFFESPVCKNMIAIFEPLKPYILSYLVSNRLMFSFYYFRACLEVEPDFEQEQINICYPNGEIITLTHPKETFDFISSWADRVHDMDRLYDQIVGVARSYDDSAFRFRDNIICFSEEIQLDLRFSKSENYIEYVMELSLADEQFEVSSKNIKEFEKSVLEYFNNWFKKKRVFALVHGLTNNFLARLCSEIVGYYGEVETYFHASPSCEDAALYAQMHFFDYPLINLEDSFTITPLPFDMKIEHKPITVEQVYSFGDRLLLSGNRHGFKDVVYMLHENELKSLLHIPA